MRKDHSQINHVLNKHWLNPELLEADQFDECFIERGEAMLKLIGEAMGKPVSGGREAFRAALETANLTDVTEPDEDEDFDPLGEAAYLEGPNDASAG